MTVNNLRKQTKDDQVIATAKALIKSWKKLLPDNAASATSTPTKSAASSEGAEQSSTSSKPSEGEKRDTDAGGDSGASTPKDEPEGSGGEGKSGIADIVSYTSDPVRLKCREMLSTALQANKPADSEGSGGEGKSGI